MGGEGIVLTYVTGTVRGPGGERSGIDFLVDSGATYTLLPHEVWTALALAPARRVTFTLADGTKVERGVAECWISIPEGSGHTPAVLGEPGDAALLGVVTLEVPGLVLNPFSRALQPMRMMLA